MSKARIFAQHLYSQNPQESHERLTVYNYFKNVCDPDDSLDAEAINNFFRRALCFEHWRENGPALVRELKICLESFHRFNGTKLDDRDLIINDPIQVFRVDDRHHFLEYLGENFSADKNYHLQEGPGESVVILKIHENGSLQIKQARPLVLFHRGNFQPLLPDVDLHYDSNLLLDEEKVQQLQIDNFCSVRFTQNAQKFRGTMVRGYTFSKIEDIEIKTCQQIPRIFFALKKVERLFIEKKSDPYYKQVLFGLEQCIEQLEKNQISVSQAQWLYEQSELAFEEVFSEDKLTELLLKDLRGLLADKMTEAALQPEVEVCQKIEPVPKNQEVLL